jgi:hypothetical protein
VGALEAARRAGWPLPEEKPSLSPLRQQLAAWQVSIQRGCHVLYLALVIWSRVHGLVMLEIDSQLPAHQDRPDLSRMASLAPGQMTGQVSHAGEVTQKSFLIQKILYILLNKGIIQCLKFT